jgi:hypothetical protein
MHRETLSRAATAAGASSLSTRRGVHGEGLQAQGLRPEHGRQLQPSGSASVPTEDVSRRCNRDLKTANTLLERCRRPCGRDCRPLTVPHSSNHYPEALASVAFPPIAMGPQILLDLMISPLNPRVAYEKVVVQRVLTKLVQRQHPRSPVDCLQQHESVVSSIVVNLPNGRHRLPASRGRRASRVARRQLARAAHRPRRACRQRGRSLNWH